MRIATIVRVAIIVFLPCILSAQPYFSHSEHMGDDDLFGSATHKNDVYFYLDLQPCSDTFLEPCVGIIKYSNGEQLSWKKTFYRNNSALLVRPSSELLCTSETGVALASTIISDPSIDEGYSVMFIDSSGAVEDSFVYHTTSVLLRAIERGPTGLYYITGIEYLSDKKRDMTIFLSVINRQGEELYHRNYYPRETSLVEMEVFYIDILDSGRILIGLRSGGRAWVMYLNADGTKRWMHPYGEYYRGIGGVPMIMGGANDNIYLSWFSHRDSFFNYDEHPNIIAIDGVNGDTLWKYHLNNGYYESLAFDLLYSRDHHLFLVGYNYNIDLYNPRQGGMIAKFDTSGNLLWNKIYYDKRPGTEPESGMAFLTIEEMNNGDLILGGQRFDTVGTGKYNRNAWIVRLNKDGECPTDTCGIEIYDAPATVKAEYVNKKQPVKFFPNPVRDQLHYTTSEKGRHIFQLYSIEGKLLIDKWMHGNTQNINVSEYPPGMYFVELRKQNGDIISRSKIIFQ